MILLFLLNLSGSIGPTAGHYVPTLDSLNSWLRDKYEAKGKIGGAFTFGAEGRVYLGRTFALEAGADYFISKSQDEARSLSLIPADVYLSYRHMILPLFLYFYLGGGFELCFTKYEEDTVEKSEWGSGPIVKAALEFIATPGLGGEISGGYRFVKAPDIEFKDPQTGDSGPIPINLWGGFFKIAIKREFW